MKYGMNVALALSAGLLAVACDREGRSSQQIEAAAAPRSQDMAQSQRSESAEQPLADDQRMDEEPVGRLRAGAQAQPEQADRMARRGDRAQQESQPDARGQSPVAIGDAAGDPQASPSEEDEQSEQKSHSSQQAQLPKEGQISVQVQGSAPESVSYAMKGDKIRVGVSAAPGSPNRGVDAIIDTSEKSAVLLLKDSKQYLEIDLAALGQAVNERAQRINIEKTGNMGTVAGKDCEQWKITDKDYQVSACVARGEPFINLSALESFASFSAPAWAHEIVDAGYVPLSVAITDAKGRPVTSSQVTQWSNDPVNESAFQIPEGYQKATLPTVPGVPGSGS